MSLTSFISKRESRLVFRGILTKQRTFKPDKPMLASPLTTNYRLVGTAFDYLLRFYLERINPNTKTKRWVASLGVSYIRDEDTHKLAEEFLHDAKKHHKNYLENGVLTDELISSSLRLAYLDGAYRGGSGRFNKDGLTRFDERDITDLRQLMTLVKEQDFKAEKACYLNPTFGFASRLVGGADADIVIDDKIIDVKTTIKFKLESNHIHQLVGYYILLSLGGIKNNSENDFNYFDEISEINSLCIYFSRHGYLHTIKTADLIPPDFLSVFVKWFIQSACSNKKDLINYYCSNFHGQVAKQLLNEISAETDLCERSFENNTASN